MSSTCNYHGIACFYQPGAHEVCVWLAPFFHVYLSVCFLDESELFLQLNIDSQQVFAENNLFLDMADKALRNREYKDFNDG